MELLKIEQVSKKIKKKMIIDNISLYVNEGEIVGFLGPNGAGKTTTIKMIMGLFSITQGKITICGHDISTDFENAIKNAGAIVESPDLYKRMTGRQNLEYFASMYDTDAEKNIDTAVDLVKMSERIDDKVKTYSLGMRQRVDLARTLLHKPSLLVLDEPTNGLDPIGIKDLRDILKKLVKESNIGVLISSHLLSEMELMCDRIYILDNGVIIDEKTIGQVKEDGEDDLYQYIFVTDNNEKVLEYFNSLKTSCEITSGGVNIAVKKDEVSGLIKTIHEMGVTIFAVNQQKKTLEQEFISITTGTKTQIK